MTQNRDIKITLQKSGEFVAFRLYDRTHGLTSRFIMAKSVFARILSGETGRDRDLRNWLEAYVDAPSNTVHFRIAWLNETYDGQLNGHEMLFTLPLDKVMAFLDNDSGGDSAKFLYRPNAHQTTPINTRKATDALRAATADKHVRRALSKALRDHFQWGFDERVTLYSDGGANFYFTTDSGFPACGGLILHRQESQDGHVKYSYGLHT